MDLDNIVCSQCHQENPPQAKYCNECGARLNNPSDGHHSLIPKGSKPPRSAERRQLTILFCDLVGSTPLSERLDPEDFRQVITNYHTVAEEVIKHHSGHIAQYLGDGLLTYFGYPEGLEEAPKLAVQAGLGILKAIEKANKKWKAEGNTAIQVRIGIHTGLVVVDDHLAIGEAVNIAARLEGLAPYNGLVISPQTWNLVQGWFTVESLGRQTLKGISEPMEIFQVTGESGLKSRFEVAKSKGLSPLVGRDRELNLIQTGWEAAKQRKGNLLLINGEAGIGKSRLIDSIGENVGNESGTWCTVVKCSTYQRNSSLYPLINWIENEVLQFDAKERVEDKLLKLEKLVNKIDPDDPTALSLMAEFLSVSVNKFPPVAMSPFAKRQKIMDKLSQIVLHHERHQCVLLVIEDLHWADASTLEWLNHFIEQIPSYSIFILCTKRPALHLDWKDRPGVRIINLDRLSQDEMATICHHQTAGKALPKRVLEMISDKTEGVPLFVEELTKMILESGFLHEKAEGYEVKGSLSAMAIPSTLQDALLARLDRLSAVREIVQVGAVLGRVFSVKMLTAVLPDHIDQIEEALSKLVNAEIVFLTGNAQQETFQFKHALIQDAAYESLLKSRRHVIHYQVANVLKDQFTEISQTQPELLAHHFTEGGHPQEAIPYWLMAGQSASQKNASTEAISHLEKGLKQLSHITDEAERNLLELDLLLTLGGCFMVAYGFPHQKVKETFNRAKDLAQGMEVTPKLALAMFNLLSYYFNTEDYKSHSLVADHMLKLAEDPDHGYWFDLFATQLVGGANIIKGNFKIALPSYDRVFELYDPSLPFPWELTPSGSIEIGAEAWKMICLQIMGHGDQAKEIANRILTCSDQYQDSMTLYHIHTFPSLFHLLARNWKEAEEVINVYLPIVRKFGDPIFMLTADIYHSIAKAFQGDKEAFETAIKLNHVCFDVGFKAFAVSMSPCIGELYVRNGNNEAALKWIDKILNHVNTTGSHAHTAELYRIKGLTLQQQGEPDATTEEFLNKALRLSRQQGARTYELRAACDLTRLWQKQGKNQEAYNLLNDVYNGFTEGFNTADLQKAKHTLNKLSVAISVAS